MAKLGKASNVISHWHHPIENFQTSTMEFYTAVEQALAPKQIPDCSTSRIDWREGGVLTARREYLRVKRGNLVFDICAAPFGTGFFFSWWLAEAPPSWGLLWALLIAYVAFLFISTCMKALGVFTGTFWGIVGVVAVFWLLGYLVRHGKIGGSGLEKNGTSHPTLRLALRAPLQAAYLLQDGYRSYVSGNGAQSGLGRDRSLVPGKRRAGLELNLSGNQSCGSSTRGSVTDVTRW